MTGIKAVFLYPESDISPLDPDELKLYLNALLPRAAVEVRERFLEFSTAGLPADEKNGILSSMAKKFASARVKDLSKPPARRDPIFAEGEIEKRFLSEGRSLKGMLYDGFSLCSALQALIPQGERNLRHVHIVITSRLIGTWDTSDRRYHARTSVYDMPSIISTSGIVEAPAKSKEYYIVKSRAAALNQSPELDRILDEFKGEHIGYGDPRITEVAKGYALQAIFFQMTGNPFCGNKHCRLFNAHWQKDMVDAQIGGHHDLCPEHEAVLKSFI